MGEEHSQRCAVKNTQDMHVQLVIFFFNLSHFNSGQRCSEIKKNKNLKLKMPDKVANAGKGCVIVGVLRAF